MARRSGIGRGLAAILPEPGEEREGELRTIPVELIRPNPEQPRKSFDPDALARLTESVAEAGVVQPLVVHALPDGRYELIAGERRWRAAREAGLKTVPAVMRSEDEGHRLQTALIENMAREDLNPIEEARACAALVEELGLSKEEVARRVGRSRSAISNLIRLLDLPEGAIELIEAGVLSEGHGRALLLTKDHGRRLQLAREAEREGWSVRETERRAKGEPAARGGGRTNADPDREAAVGRAEDALERALGRDVKVGFRGERLRAELLFDDLDELLAVAAALRCD